MRKRVTLFLCLLTFAISSAGCSEQNLKDKNITFVGIVEELNDNSILVGSIDGADFDRASVFFDENTSEVNFNLIVGQMLRITILPEIRESYPVQVTAVSIERVFESAIKNSNQPDFTASYYRADSYTDGGFSFLSSRALNSQTFAMSSVQHLPIIRIDSKVELDEFIKGGSDYFQFDAIYNDISFKNGMIKYSDEFFKDNHLLIISAEESSGSSRHAIESLTMSNGGLAVGITRIVPESGTCDMADWFIVIEISKIDTVDVERWDALVVK